MTLSTAWRSRWASGATYARTSRRARCSAARLHGRQASRCRHRDGRLRGSPAVRPRTRVLGAHPAHQVVGLPPRSAFVAPMRARGAGILGASRASRLSRTAARGFGSPQRSLAESLRIERPERRAVSSLSRVHRHAHDASEPAPMRSCSAARRPAHGACDRYAPPGRRAWQMAIVGGLMRRCQWLYDARSGGAAQAAQVACSLRPVRGHERAIEYLRLDVAPECAENATRTLQRPCRSGRPLESATRQSEGAAMATVRQTLRVRIRSAPCASSHRMQRDFVDPGGFAKRSQRRFPLAGDRRPSGWTRCAPGMLVVTPRGPPPTHRLRPARSCAQAEGASATPADGASWCRRVRPHRRAQAGPRRAVTKPQGRVLRTDLTRCCTTAASAVVVCGVTTESA